MRAYFEKLLDSSQQQKQLPLIYPFLIALFSGAVFSFALAPYSLLVVGNLISCPTLCDIT